MAVELEPSDKASPRVLPVRLLAEFGGTMFLVAAIVGSGIMAQSLSPGDTGLQLLENAITTGVMLFALIALLGPVSGAHLNPAVTAADAWFGGVRARESAGYIAVQIAGACTGAILANLMFELTPINVSTHERAGAGLFLSEVVATFGLVMLILGLVRSGRSQWVAAGVAAYIVGAYWFTSSTSFANPAVTIGRTLSDTFAGIAPESVPAFLVAQVVGTALAVAAATVLWPRPAHAAVVVAVDVTEETR